MINLIKESQSNGFWGKITVAKSVGLQKTIQKLTKQQQKMDKRQNELRKSLAIAYKNKVKGVMDDEAFVLSSNQFKRECDQLKGIQHKNPEKI